jgi:prepilin-type processing-associated H-X9-DG protein
MRNWITTLGVLFACTATWAGDKPQIEADGIDMQGLPVYNYGLLDMAASSNDFTSANMANHVISVGQLVGINPETGQMITNSVNLIPIMVRSAYVAGEVNAGTFTGDGSGLSNLDGAAVVGYLPISAMPTSGVWNVSGLTLQNANFEGPITVGGDTMEVSSDLEIQGTLSGDASGLSNIPAGGTDGSLQFNSDGSLAGNTNYFIHAETGKMGYYSEGSKGNLWRVYADDTVAESNLIYIVRRYGDTTELRMLQDGTDGIRLRGDGTAYIAGDLEIGGNVTFADGSVAGSDGWYIPESGDLSMGSYTQE